MPLCGGSAGGKQLFAVMRHSERLDHVDPDAWNAMPESDDFPFDGPITTRGKKLAQDQTRLLASKFRKHDIHLIVTSPYHRCVQTALEARQVILESGQSTDVALQLDVEIGEVNIPPEYEDGFPEEDKVEFNKYVMRRRTFDEVMALPDMTGIPVQNDAAFTGVPPVFWEDRKTAQIRGLMRLYSLLEHGRKRSINILVVTHQDIVHVFNSSAGRIAKQGLVESVTYCGWGALLISPRKPVPEAKNGDRKSVSAKACQFPLLKELKFEYHKGPGVKIKVNASKKENEVEAVARTISDDTDEEAVTKFNIRQSAIVTGMKAKQPITCESPMSMKSASSTDTSASGRSRGKKLSTRSCKELEKELIHESEQIELGVQLSAEQDVANAADLFKKKKSRSSSASDRDDGSPLGLVKVNSGNSHLDDILGNGEVCPEASPVCPTKGTLEVLLSRRSTAVGEMV